MPIEIKNREYNYLGSLKIRRSKLISKEEKPQDDVVKWFSLNVNGINYSFIYDIIEKNEATYDKFFEVRISLINFDLIKREIVLKKSYNVYRGEEMIGEIKLHKVLDIRSK
ncbi:hypothetical protein [Tenacibaculum aiptasiae]|uniref:hypothetical protein n=1 Tax=Tenacibaculum aiptasiae TaxID=426481 RepID=UPI003B5C1AEA